MKEKLDGLSPNLKMKTINKILNLFNYQKKINIWDKALDERVHGMKRRAIILALLDGKVKQ